MREIAIASRTTGSAGQAVHGPQHVHRGVQRGLRIELGRARSIGHRPVLLACFIGCGLLAPVLLGALGGMYGSLTEKQCPRYGIGLVEKNGYVEELLFRNVNLRDKLFDALQQALQP